jgi:hypothetical protein
MFWRNDGINQSPFDVPADGADESFTHAKAFRQRILRANMGGTLGLD